MEEDEFKEMMWGVNPLKKGQEKITFKKELPDLKQHTSHDSHIKESTPTQKAVKFMGGMQAKKATKKLNINRHLRPEATLDLHGLTLEESTIKTRAFIANAQAAGDRVILIITGKGINSGEAGAVLKTGIWELLTWELEERVHFQLAPRHLGGDGAILIVLY